MDPQDRVTYQRVPEGSVIDREVRVHDDGPRPRFWTGFIVALLAIAAGIGIWAIVSDDDDDGSVNVPSVSVDADVDLPGNP